MKITIEQLIDLDLDACPGGIEWFRSTFGDTYEIAEWTPVQQAGLLMDREGRKFFAWAVSLGLTPAWSMLGWDLSGANLRGANLRGARTEGAIGLE